MPDFPIQQRINQVSIGSFSMESVLIPLVANAASFAASTAWPSANLAIYIPVEIYQPVTIANMSVNNGATASGNIDVGIYDANGVKLVSAGSTAQTGTSAIQTFNITDTLLLPGLYYLAVALDNGTGTLAGWTSVPALEFEAIGCFQQASAFALPATATFAAYTQTFIPVVSITPKTTI